MQLSSGPRAEHGRGTEELLPADFLLCLAHAALSVCMRAAWTPACLSRLSRKQRNEPNEIRWRLLWPVRMTDTREASDKCGQLLIRGAPYACVQFRPADVVIVAAPPPPPCCRTCVMCTKWITVHLYERLWNLWLLCLELLRVFSSELYVLRFKARFILGRSFRRGEVERWRGDRARDTLKALTAPSSHSPIRMNDLLMYVREGLSDTSETEVMILKSNQMRVYRCMLNDTLRLSHIVCLI